jgi:hypothetical protein
MSADKIIQEYRRKGGKIDNNFAYRYVAETTAYATLLHYEILYQSPAPSVEDTYPIDALLTKKKIIQRANALLNFAKNTGALYARVELTRIATRTTTLKTTAFEKPFVFEYTREL